MRVRREGLDLAPRAHMAERHGSRAWVQTRGALRAAAHGVGRAAAPSSAVPILKAAWPHVVAVHGAHAAPPVAIQLRLHLPQPTHRLVEIDQEDRQGRPTRVVGRPSWRVHHASRGAMWSTWRRHKGARGIYSGICEMTWLITKKGVKSRLPGRILENGPRYLVSHKAGPGYLDLQSRGPGPDYLFTWQPGMFFCTGSVRLTWYTCNMGSSE